MYSPNQGVAVVSDAGMKTFFYSLFSNAMANADSLGVVRVVGGYDPLKDEFLLSVINNANPSLASGGGGMRTSLFPLEAIGLNTPVSSIVSIILAALL